MAEGRLVGGVVGGEDVGKAWGDPVPACGDLPDRGLYLAGLLVFHGIAERPGAHRGPDGERFVGGREDQDRRARREDGGYVALNGGPVVEVEIEEDNVCVASGSGEQSVYGRRGTDDPDVTL